MEREAMATQLKKMTGYEAGLSGDDQIRLALQRIIERGGAASIQDIYDAVENNINLRGFTLSEQGKASLRFFVNKVAVKAGYVSPFDKDDPTWKITPAGREYLSGSPSPREIALNLDTRTEEEVESHSARGTAFERWILQALRKWYPHYSWYYQGRHKQNERGLDFVGERIGDARNEFRSIGVQVKFHKASNAPTEMEWLKFLSGCFARRVDTGIFITTGSLTSAQRREAQEARVTVVEGREEVVRLADLYGVEKFDLFDDPNH